jgi:alcohol dehydrogenase class IV
MLPHVALVDPELALGLPRAITASTGMDALSQLIEPFVSHRANPMTNALCREGIRRAARSLSLACDNGANLVAREDMGVASLFSGMALANAGLGAVHGLAAPIGGMFPAPHGAVCAALLAPVMECNVRAIRAGDPGSYALSRYEEVAHIVTGKPAARIEDGIAWVRDLAKGLGIPSLGAYGITKSDFPALAEKAAASNSMKGNPIALTQVELAGILRGAL